MIMGDKRSTVCCKNCGHAAFYRKDVRKTKVSIILGEAVRHEGRPEKVFTIYYCAKCGRGLSREVARKVCYSPSVCDNNN